MTYNELTLAQQEQVAQLFAFGEPELYQYDVGSNGRIQGARPVVVQMTCYECGREFGRFEDVHTNSAGEDVCAACCDVCEAEERVDDDDECWTRKHEGVGDGRIT